MSAFRVKLGANDLNCVDVPLNHTHSLNLIWSSVCPVKPVMAVALEWERGEGGVVALSVSPDQTPL